MRQMDLAKVVSMCGHVQWAVWSRLPSRRLCSSVTFQWGEFVLSEDQKARQRLFKLKEGGVVNSSSGQIAHKEIIGREPCQKFVTDDGFHLWLRRPTLAEYVCLMQRAATPTYPKDIWAMMGYLDIGGGSRVIEAGSGSGALALHLSNHVGASGQVYSFENVHRHHIQAKINFQNWTSSWNSHHPDNPWPDNVHFIEANVFDAEEHIHTTLDAAALDIVNPSSIVDKLVNILRPGSVMAAYLPNVTQVMDLRVHLEKSQLPLRWERVVEVVHRNWTVKPAVSKHRAALERLQKSDNSVDVFPTYIARPSHHQEPHTAFLAVLRRSLVTMGKRRGI